MSGADAGADAANSSGMHVNAVGDRRARGEAGMSVLKWRLQQLNGKTRDRDRAAKADCDDIELITDEANNVAATAAASAAASATAERHSSRKDSASSNSSANGTGSNSGARSAGRRMGMRDKLGISQVQRGKEIRRVEMRRKKSRKHSDDDDKDAASLPTTPTAAADDGAAADGRTNRAAEGNQQTTRGRRDEESKQQLDGDRDTGAAGGAAGDFISALHHNHNHDGKAADAHEEGEDERRRRKDKQLQQPDGQSLRVALEAHGPGPSERTSKRSGHSSSASRPLTLSQQLQRLHRGSDAAVNARHTSHVAATSAATSRPHTPPAPSAAVGSNDQPLTAPTAQSVDEQSYSLSAPPPASLPFLPALSHSLSFFRPSSLSRRWSHFHSLCVSPTCVSLVRAVYFRTFVDHFQNNGRSMREALLVDINRHFSRLLQLIDITLTLPSTAHTEDEQALYAHLVTLMPEDIVVSSAPPHADAPVNSAVKARLLTALPLLLSSAVFSLLYSLFPLSRHLLTLSFLHRLDCSLLSLTCGFDMAASTVDRQRATFFEERPIEAFSLLPNTRIASTADQSHAAAAAGVDGRAGNLFSRGDWAQDEKERREQMERRKALTSPHSPSPSALSPDFIRSDPSLSPYQRVLLLELITPPSGGRQQLLNANSLSPLLQVGLQRNTPDSSWRMEHKLRYVTGQPRAANSGLRSSGDGGGGSNTEHRAVRASSIEEEAERWVRKMRGEGGRRSRHKGKAAVEHDDPSGSTTRAVNGAAAAALANAASSASTASQREKIVEGDPLAVLTPRTRKLVLRYSTKDDDDESPAQQQQQQQQQTKETSKAVKGPSSPRLLNAKGSAAHVDDVLTLDLNAKIVQNEHSATTTRKTARLMV